MFDISDFFFNLDSLLLFENCLLVLSFDMQVVVVALIDLREGVLNTFTVQQLEHCGGINDKYADGIHFRYDGA